MLQISSNLFLHHRFHQHPHAYIDSRPLTFRRLYWWRVGGSHSRPILPLLFYAFNSGCFDSFMLPEFDCKQYFPFGYGPLQALLLASLDPRWHDFSRSQRTLPLTGDWKNVTLPYIFL